MLYHSAIMAIIYKLVVYSGSEGTLMGAVIGVLGGGLAMLIIVLLILMFLRKCYNVKVKIHSIRE